MPGSVCTVPPGSAVAVGVGAAPDAVVEARVVLAFDGGFDAPGGRVVAVLLPELGGPLFFSHYSFMGLDPHGLKDQYADYWQQNQRHTQINRAYCVANPNVVS